MSKIVVPTDSLGVFSHWREKLPFNLKFSLELTHSIRKMLTSTDLRL